MEDRKELRVFRKISDTIRNNLVTETNYDKVIEKSANDLNITTEQLKSYLTSTTIRAIRELEENEN